MSIKDIIETYTAGAGNDDWSYGAMRKLLTAVAAAVRKAVLEEVEKGIVAEDEKHAPQGGLLNGLEVAARMVRRMKESNDGDTG